MCFPTSPPVLLRREVAKHKIPFADEPRTYWRFFWCLWDFGFTPLSLQVLITGVDLGVLVGLMVGCGAASKTRRCMGLSRLERGKRQIGEEEGLSVGANDTGFEFWLCSCLI